MKKLFDQVVGSVTKAGRDTAFTVESSALEARDAVRNKATAIAGSVEKTYRGAVMAVGAVSSFGIIMAGIFAPVPTFIGITILWILEQHIKTNAGLVDKAVETEQAQRKLDRVTAMLKKYGKIPEVALLESEGVSMSINNVTGEVTGKILKGEFEGLQLEDLSEDDLTRLIEFCSDQDTKNILEGYASLRKTRTECAEKPETDRVGKNV